MSAKKVNKDSDDDEREESGEDFSASEDEYEPGNDDHVSDEDDDEQPSEHGDEIESSTKKVSKPKKSAKAKKNTKAKNVKEAPKRRASTNRQTTSAKVVFKDSDDDFEESEESGEDFSASEDEWKPGKDDHVSEEEDDEQPDDGSEVSDEDESSNKIGNKRKKGAKAKKITKAPKLNTSINRRQTASQSLRSKLFRRYNPPPKTLKPTSPSSRSPVPSSVAAILSNSEYKGRKQMDSSASSSKDSKSARAVLSDSESSDEDGLVDPNEIDFSSTFFNAKANNQADGAPVFDCNAGVNLTDSSDGDEDESLEEVEDKPKGKSSLIDKINKKSSTEVHDFKNLQEFAKNLESAKAQLSKLKEKESAAASKVNDDIDVTKLLSMGEGTSAAAAGTPSSRKRKHDNQMSDDSDWENVSDNEHHGNEIKDIQIHVGGTGIPGLSRDEKKKIDLEACLKRRLNRDIKEKQVYLHKTSVVCWLAHGNFINRLLNNMTLMQMCQKLMPSKNAYPDGDTDVKYFKSITAWFNSVFELKSKHLYSPLKKIPAKAVWLALQIQKKRVLCKRDYVLLFVILLRSIGIQCRLVINFAVPPLKPPQKDLFVVSSKPKDEVDDKATAKTKGSSLAKKIKVSAEKQKGSFIDKKSETATKKSSDKKQEAPEKPKAASSKSKPEKAAKTNESSKSRASDKKLSQSPSKHKSPVKSDHDYTKRTSDKHSKAGPSTKEVKESPKATKSSDAKATSKEKEKSSRSSISAKQGVDSPKRAAPSTPTTNGTKEKSLPRKLENKIILKPSSSPSLAFSPRKTRSKASQNDGTKENVIGAKLRLQLNSGSTAASDASKSKAKLKLKLPQLDGADDVAKSKKIKRKPAKREDSGSDSDFAPSPPKKVSKIPPKKPQPKVLGKLKKIDRRVLSTDEENDEEVSNTDRMDFWIEAYAEKEKKWIVIDPVKNKVDAVDHIRKLATKPIIYVFAWNNDNTIRDVTPRYCSHFHTTTRKLRAEQLWLDDALRFYIEQRNARTIIEDVEFSKLHMDTPMPTSISEFKNHPMYALERHLLKFEAIYPQNALTLGYIRNEPIYARDCVHTLHSREIWVKQARTVKVGEKPYKIVKARPKWNRMLNQMEEAKPLEIFGFWQTEAYKPPVAENGIVPRNPYGNVELFKPEMLPIGTRHIRLPALNKTCKKMKVDCAQAVIGFDFHSGSSHPTFDGFVVCEEFADEVIAQWEKDQEEIERKEQEKFEARVYGNWKKLIKGLLIRERLKRKFNFGTNDKHDKSDGKKKAK